MVVKLSEIDDLSRPEHHFLEPGDRCFFLWEYTPNRGYKFSEANNLILNFKKSPDRQDRPEWQYKEQAIEKIAEAFLRSLRAEWIRSVTLVPIPPSGAKGSPQYDDRILSVLGRLDEKIGRSLDVRELILQRESTVADHKAAQRQPLEALIDNYCFNEEIASPVPTRIALFDDLLTTGRHFKAAKQLLQTQYPDMEILGIFVARSSRGPNIREMLMSEK